MKGIFVALAAGLVLTVAAPTIAAEKPKEARIAFANNGGIYNWRAVDRDTLLIQGTGKRWYKAELFAPAFSLRSVETIGFETDATDSFDRYSNVIVEGRRYPLRSLIEIEAPPTRKRDRVKKAD